MFLGHISKSPELNARIIFLQQTKNYIPKVVPCNQLNG